MSLDQAGIIIPVYNEGENIGPALTRIFEEVTVPYRVYIVYDFDEDSTLGPAQATAKAHQKEVVLLKNKYGRGALNAIKTGLETVQAQFLVVTMADLSDPPQVINAMVQKAEQDGDDLVCGSRYMPGGRQIGGPAFKGALSRLAGVSLHYLTGIHTRDCTNSFKLYRKSMLDQFTIESSGGFEIGLEIVAKAFAGGFKISEVPTTWIDRANGESRFRLFAWLPKYLKWYFYALRAVFTRR